MPTIDLAALHTSQCSGMVRSALHLIGRGSAVAVLLVGCRSKISETVVLGAETGFPCELRVVDLGVDLRAGLNDTVPDPQNVLRSHSGFFATTNDAGGGVAVWDTNGVYRRTIGRHGSGPGEISGGAIEIFFDHGDTLHVRDNAIAWSVFSPTGSFIRRISAKDIGTSFRDTHFLADGTVLITATQGDFVARNYFHIVDHSGNMIHAFGPVSRGERRLRQNVQRISAVTTNSTFWVTSLVRVGKGYALEEWSLDGQLLRRVHRDVSWFPVSTSAYSRTEAKPARPPAQVYSLYADSSGLLFVALVVPNEKWRPPHSPFEEPDREMVDIHYEVLDPRGRVLGSANSRDPSVFPVRLFNNSRTGYRTVSDVDGFVHQKIVVMELRSEKNHGACESNPSKTGETP